MNVADKPLRTVFASYEIACRRSVGYRVARDHDVDAKRTMDATFRVRFRDLSSSIKQRSLEPRDST